MRFVHAGPISVAISSVVQLSITVIYIWGGTDERVNLFYAAGEVAGMFVLYYSRNRYYPSWMIILCRALLT